MEVPVRVRFAETDAQGIAYHSNYLVWLEVARTELFRRYVGESPADFFRSHGMSVIEAAIRYHRPCRYDDELLIRIDMSRLRSRSIRFDYAVYRGEDLVSDAYTVHVCVDAVGEPCRIPADVRKALLRGEAGGDGS